MLATIPSKGGRRPRLRKEGGREEGGKRKEEGGRRKEEGGKRKEEGERRKGTNFFLRTLFGMFLKHFLHTGLSSHRKTSAKSVPSPFSQKPHKKCSWWYNLRQKDICAENFRNSEQ
jgi:hypothetical protein